MSNYLSELNSGIAPNPSNNVFSDIWGEYERVILHNLVTSFGLDFLVHDQRGGDVDTVQGVRETGTFKNSAYAQKYGERGKYSTHDYHSDDSYTTVTAEARRQFNETGTPIEDVYAPGNLLIFNKAEGPWRRVSLDHIISAHEVHDDPVRMLADLDGISLANDPENLRYTSISLNTKMSDMTIDEFIGWCDEHPDKVNWNGENGAPLPEEVKQRLREEDARAREHYEARIAKSYYTSPQFYADAVTAAGKRGLEMGARQALGFVFLEIYYACEDELGAVPPGSNFKECFEAIIRGIPKGLDNARLRYKDLMSQFAQGFWAGALASLTTTLCSIFFTTEKNMVRYIRQGYAAVVQAGNVLLINPDDLLLGDQLKMTTIVLGSGASVIAGTYVGDLISKTPIASVPEVGPVVTRFVSVLVSGLLSCTMLILLDRSKLVNTLIGKMNQYATVEHTIKETSKAFENMAAEIEGYDIDAFSTQCLQFRLIAAKIGQATSEEELSSLLMDALTYSGICLPWDGDFDVFMSDPSGRLVFS